MLYGWLIKNHRPRGRMCVSCVRRSDNCSDLIFKSMPVIGKDADGMNIVRCTGYQRDTQNHAEWEAEV